MALELTVEKLLQMRGKPVFDMTGEKIGAIEDIYIDDETREPEWIALGTGFLGMKHAIAPLLDASLHDDGIEIPYDKGTVKDAPELDRSDMSAEDERKLAGHYGLSGHVTAPDDGSGAPRGTPKSQTKAHRHVGTTPSRDEEPEHQGPVGRDLN